MSQIFDIIFEGGFAYQALLGTFMALLSMLLGGLLVFIEIYQSNFSPRAKAKIVSVCIDSNEKKIEQIKRFTNKTLSSNVYYPVYEFKNKNGDIVQKMSNQGSSSLISNYPGIVHNVILEGTTDQIPRQKTPMIMIVGLFFTLVGIFLLFYSFSIFRINTGSLLMCGIVMAWIGFKLSKLYTKLHKAGAFTQMREMRASGEPFIKMGEIKTSTGSMTSPKRPLETNEIRQRLDIEKKQSRQWSLFFVLFAVAGFGLSYYLGAQTYFLVTHGQSAKGNVVDFETSFSTNNNSNSLNYYAIFEFTDPQGQIFRVKDKIGASHPMYSSGEEIKVLFDQANPQFAIIDRGIWNWLPTVLIGFLAFLSFWGAIKLFSRSFFSGNTRPQRV